MAAARELGVDRTTVARRLDRLEERLGTKLFERISGELELTLHGRRTLAVMERAEQELSHLYPDKDDARIAFGKVRVSLSPHVLAGFSKEVIRFAESHPQIFPVLATSDRFVDLHRYEADIALRVAVTRPHDLHSIDLGPVRFGLYSRSDQRGPLRAVLTPPGQTELPREFVPQSETPIVVASVDGVLPTRELVLAGAGAGLLPQFIAEDDPRLALVSDGLAEGRHRLWISCLAEQKANSRIRTAMKGLSGEIAQRLKALDPGGR
ncbi:LysR family transcriptional regulator [Alphaproteobacteria bacterium GH1-50]|uniref:LysR family transcriptional regulator n=2 Tax=Kangsaoukella pontilimi TaxID=2691042 RepID=A0A7C9MYC9_9RHOB|nr:LysR family transcriptional regulator [Kangsaoukella pontilimi]